MKRFITVLMSAMIALSMMPSMAFAAEEGCHSVAAVKGTLFDTLQGAVDAAQAGQKIELLKDVDLGSSNLVVNKAICIDGGAGKHTIQSSTSGDVIKVLTNASSLDGTVELKNLTIKATNNKMTARAIGIGSSSAITNLNLVVEDCEIETTQRGITVNANNNEAINLDVRGTTISLTNGITDYDTEVNSTNDFNNSRGISLWEMGDSDVTITNSTIQGFFYSINAAGTNNGNMTVNVNSSSFKGRAAVNAWSSNTEWNISNCKIRGINNFPGNSEGFATIVTNETATGNRISIDNTYFTTYFNEDGANNPHAKEYLVALRGAECKVVVDKNTSGSAYSIFSDEKGGILETGNPDSSSITLYNGCYSTNPLAYRAEGKNIYHQHAGNYFVGSMPASTSGYNAWALQDGIYEETYVAPAEPETPDAPVIDNSGSGDNASTNVDASASTVVKDDKAETSINSTTGNKIVENAKENNVSEVVIKAETEKGDSTGSTVALPESTVQALAKDTEASVTIKTDSAEVSLDKAAVNAVAAQAGTDGEVKLEVVTVENTEDTLKVELKLVTSKGKVIDFQGGNVTVTVPVSDELASKKLVCVYIDDNGKYIKMDGSLASDGKTFTFTTGHFSTYAILSEEEANAAIDGQNISKATVSGLANKTYTGKAITQKLTVKAGDKALVEGTDYTVSYSKNVNVGVASVKITGKGKYEGTLTKTFKINPKGTSISKVTGQKKAVKVVWKKQLTKMKTSYVSGYQVQYSTSSKFTSGTSKYANAKFSKGRTTKTIKNLKSGKKYYVRVRTYKSVDGTKCYSSWSKAKSVKTK